MQFSFFFTFIFIFIFGLGSRSAQSGWHAVLNAEHIRTCIKNLHVTKRAKDYGGWNTVLNSNPEYWTEFDPLEYLNSNRVVREKITREFSTWLQNEGGSELVKSELSSTADALWDQWAKKMSSFESARVGRLILKIEKWPSSYVRIILGHFFDFSLGKMKITFNWPSEELLNMPDSLVEFNHEWAFNFANPDRAIRLALEVALLNLISGKIVIPSSLGSHAGPSDIKAIAVLGDSKSALRKIDRVLYNIATTHDDAMKARYAEFALFKRSLMAESSEEARTIGYAQIIKMLNGKSGSPTSLPSLQEQETILSLIRNCQNTYISEAASIVADLMRKRAHPSMIPLPEPFQKLIFSRNFSELRLAIHSNVKTQGWIARYLNELLSHGEGYVLSEGRFRPTTRSDLGQAHPFGVEAVSQFIDTFGLGVFLQTPSRINELRALNLSSGSGLN